MALFKRKDKDGKRKGENAIGKIIYGFLLFMPLIAVLTACLYVVLNKNAYQSYHESQIQAYNKVTTNNNLLQEGEKYQNTLLQIVDHNTEWIYFTEIDQKVLDKFDSLYNYVAFRYVVTNQRMDLLDTNGVEHNRQYSQTNPDLTNFQFRLKTVPSTYTYYVTLVNVYLVTFTNETLDNVFYYQMQKLEESDLFNWTKNTGAYTVMHNVTEGIGITNTYTPMLMTYWLLISVIYFIFDIALILVWAVHDKIHELKDAI